MAELAIPTLGRVFDATTTSSSTGVALTAPGSANTKSSYTQLISSTSTHSTGLLVSIVQGPASTANETILVDIAFGAASSEVVMVGNLMSEALFYAGNFAPHVYSYLLPIPVPAGTRVAARYQSSRSSAWGTVRVQAQLLGGGAGYVGSGMVETWGATTGTSRGTSVDPGGTANTKGSYAQLVASSTSDTHGIIVAAGSQNTDAGGTLQNEHNWTLDIAVGSAGSEQIVVADLPLARWWSTTLTPTVFPPLPVSIAAGSRVSARLQFSRTTATTSYRALDVAVYAIQ